jgi:hypothetical protein
LSPHGAQADWIDCAERMVGASTKGAIRDRREYNHEAFEHPRAEMWRPVFERRTETAQQHVVIHHHDPFRIVVVRLEKERTEAS